MALYQGTDLEAAEKIASSHSDTQWRNPYCTDNLSFALHLLDAPAIRRWSLGIIQRSEAL